MTGSNMSVLNKHESRAQSYFPMMGMGWGGGKGVEGGTKKSNTVMPRPEV